MTRASSPRERKPTVWDSQIAVCRRLGYLHCEDQVEQIDSELRMEMRSCPVPSF